MIIILLATAVCMGAVLDTQRDGWSKPRGAITTDDTLVSASYSTMKFANIPTHAYQPATRQNIIEVAWVMDANDSSCVAYLYAAKYAGDIVLVWSGTITAGAQVSTSGGYYVDTIASSTKNWATTITECDASGSNRMTRLLFDTCGYKYFFFQYTGLSSESVQAYFSGF